MEDKKYELLKDDYKEVYRFKLYRIRALKDFGDVKKGEVGGYIEKEENLSQKKILVGYTKKREYSTVRKYTEKRKYAIKQKYMAKQKYLKKREYSAKREYLTKRKCTEKR